LIYRSGLKNADADGMFRYPDGNITTDYDRQIILEDSTIKAICSTQTQSLIEVIPSCSINIVDVTECQGEPFAQIETR
jgi:uncharacterized protein YjdB